MSGTWEFDGEWHSELGFEGERNGNLTVGGEIDSEWGTEWEFDGEWDRE